MSAAASSGLGFSSRTLADAILIGSVGVPVSTGSHGPASAAVAKSSQLTPAAMIPLDRQAAPAAASARTAPTTGGGSRIATTSMTGTRSRTTNHTHGAAAATAPAAVCPRRRVSG